MNEFPPLDGIPAWPDVEDLMCTYLDRFGHTCTETPPAEDEFGAPLFESLLPVIVIERSGGGTPNGAIDVAMIHISVTNSTRSGSWAVMNNGVRRAVSAAENGAVIDDYVIVGMSEEVGPQMIPGLNPDTRTVQLAFQVVVQRPR